jgi:TRAP-type C4-dicarboxylate transport system substrate-binding protein
MENEMKINRRKLVGGGLLAASAVAAPSVARAQTVKWRMVTSWPKRLPGPGMSAERVAERITALSGGRIQITVHAAGEVVPAFEVLDAVGGGVEKRRLCGGVGFRAAAVSGGRAGNQFNLSHGEFLVGSERGYLCADVFEQWRRLWQ